MDCERAMRFLVYVVIFYASNLLSGCGTLVASIDDVRIESALAESKVVNVKFEQQLSQLSCGLAVLVSVSRYWEIELDQMTLLHRYPPASEREGYSIGELKRIATESGSQAFGVAGDINFLQKHLTLGRPIIVPLEKKLKVMRWVESLPLIGSIYRALMDAAAPTYNHYVVVIGYRDDGLWIMDPDDGIVLVSTDEFIRMWKPLKQAALLVAK